MESVTAFEASSKHWTSTSTVLYTFMQLNKLCGRGNGLSCHPHLPSSSSSILDIMMHGPTFNEQQLWRPQVHLLAYGIYHYLMQKKINQTHACYWGKRMVVCELKAELMLN